MQAQQHAVVLKYGGTERREPELTSLATGGHYTWH